MTWNFERIFDVINIATFHVSSPYGKLTYAEKSGKFQIGTNLV